MIKFRITVQPLRSNIHGKEIKEMGSLTEATAFTINTKQKSFKNIWGKVFKNGPSKICVRQPLKNFTWSILEYFAPSDADIKLGIANSSDSF